MRPLLLVLLLLAATQLVSGMMGQQKVKSLETPKESARARLLNSLVIPLKEELIRSHFRIPAGTPLPVSPTRVTNISREAFREYALRGNATGAVTIVVACMLFSLLLIYFVPCVRV